MKTLLVALLLVPSVAFAQTEVRFQLLPPGQLVQVKGEKMRGYLLEEWLQIAEADAELVKLRADVVDLEAMVKKLEGVVEKKDVEIATLERDKDILTKRGLRCDEDLKKCETDLIDAAGGPWWPYIVAAGGAVLGIVGTTLYLSSR